MLYKEFKELGITGSNAANRTCDWLRSYVWEVTDGPPYSPNLMPSDFSLYGPVKKQLACEGFAPDADMKQAVIWQWTLDI